MINLFMAPLIHSIISVKAIVKKFQIMVAARTCADFWVQLSTPWRNSPEISCQGCLIFGISFNKVFGASEIHPLGYTLRGISHLSGIAIGGQWDWTSWVTPCHPASVSLWLLFFSSIVNQFFKFIFPFRLHEVDLPWCVVPCSFIKITMGRGVGNRCPYELAGSICCDA